MNYAKENEFGRQRAMQAIDDCRLTGNVPRFVRLVRDATFDETGAGIGFLYACARMLLSK